VRLGPIALFLAIVSIILVMLALLSVATSNADRVLAERFAAVTKERYALEADGERFIMALDEQAVKGKIKEADLMMEKTKTGYKKSIKATDYILNIEVTKPDQSGKFNITKWEIKKKWKEDNPYKNIWKGED
jgi:hypothetical protein